tara:strand:+ start:1272 stop:1646 length:375 start_codon:yes stop_codon:yes gene_type:complete
VLGGNILYLDVWDPLLVVIWLLIVYFCLPLRGNSSVGRASGCHPEGREFESRFPLHFFSYQYKGISVLEQIMLCLVCFLGLSIAWFTPQAGTEEINKPLGKQFAVIACLSIPIALLLSRLFGIV